MLFGHEEQAMVRKKFRPVTLQVEVLEERCTPAVLITAIQPPSTVVIMTQPVVRTDLFGGAHDESATPDPLAFPEVFASQESDFVKPAPKNDAEPAARPAQTQRVVDDAPAPVIAEPTSLCVVLEYD
jgi:hypothetical protein